MNNPILDEPAQSQAGQTPKERLECLKLEVEIAQLKKPLWRHGGFWVTLLTAGTVVIGGVISWSSGWFDLKQLEIKNGNLLLEAENKRLLAQKEALTSETSKLDASQGRVFRLLAPRSHNREESKTQYQAWRLGLSPWGNGGRLMRRTWRISSSAGWQTPTG
jgi:hypothetical protein